MAFITIAGEQLIAQKQGASQALVIQSFVLANIPGLGAEPANRIEALPIAGDIVDTKPVTYQGYVNSNQVVYSLALDSTIGDYDFNWVGLKSAEGVLVACEHISLTQKRKTTGPTPGNNLTRNFLLSFSGATATTAISVPASTWQIDFTTRLLEIDDRERLSNLDDYGIAAFFDAGFNVSLSSGSTYNINAGTGYIYGIRCQMASSAALNAGSLPKGIWMDVSLQGNINGVAPVISFSASATTLTNYTDSLGFKHYFTKIADISSGGLVTDLRETVIVSQAEAQAGISTTIRKWNALRVKQAALASLKMPSYHLQLPVINTTTNTLTIGKNSVTGQGGTVSISPGTYFTLANYVSPGFGVISEYQTVSFTSPVLAVFSTYFLRAQINDAGNLIFYVQKGVLNDATPATLKGVENGLSGGGFYSTAYDICLAQIITGFSGTIPTVRPVINSKNNRWPALLAGGGTAYLPLDPFVLKATLTAAVMEPNATQVSTIINGSSGWSYSSYVYMSPIAGSGLMQAADIVSNYSTTSPGVILSANVAGDIGISVANMAFDHKTGRLIMKVHHAEHQITSSDASGGDEELLGIGIKALNATDYSSGLAITYANCDSGMLTWEISR